MIDNYLLTGAAVVVPIALFFWAYNKFTLGYCDSTQGMEGKTVIITGANTGIGYEAAKDLAKRGARVIMACRNPQRGEAALAKLKEETGCENVILKILDVSLTASVRKFAEEIIAEEERLDVLINNAGLTSPTKQITSEGLEVVYATNHFGHFLLTNLLLGLTTYSLHPGAVNTEIWRSQSRFLRSAIRFLTQIRLLKTPEQGAQTTIYCAVTPGIEPQSGGYFSDCRLKRESAKGRDDEVAKRLWEISEKITGLVN